jgi:hypothetical protein
VGLVLVQGVCLQVGSVGQEWGDLPTCPSGEVLCALSLLTDSVLQFDWRTEALCRTDEAVVLVLCVSVYAGVLLA